MIAGEPAAVGGMVMGRSAGRPAAPAPLPAAAGGMTGLAIVLGSDRAQHAHAIDRLRHLS